MRPASCFSLPGSKRKGSFTLVGIIGRRHSCLLAKPDADANVRPCPCQGGNPAIFESLGAGPASIPAWTFTNEAASRFAVFEAWAPRTMAAGTRLQAPLRLREHRGAVVDE